MPKKHTQSNKVRKRKGKDLDEIHEDLKPDKKRRLQEERLAVPDLDQTGLGQHFCCECSRYFVDDLTLQRHRTGKPHKRRLKALTVPVYTQKEADAAGGLISS